MNREETERYIHDMQARTAQQRVCFRGRAMPMRLGDTLDRPSPVERRMPGVTLLVACIVGAGIWTAAFWLLTHNELLKPLVTWLWRVW